jgi:hypothetical protein
MPGTSSWDKNFISLRVIFKESALVYKKLEHFHMTISGGSLQWGPAVLIFAV